MSLLSKIKAEQASKTSRPETITTQDINLRGTGLTKREGEKNTRAYERETQRSMKADKDTFIEKVDSEFQKSVDETLASLREQNRLRDIQFDESQLRAVAGISHNQVCVLIGPAGSGKTTLERFIIETNQEHMTKVKLADITFVYARKNKDEKQYRILLREAMAQKLEIIGLDKELETAETVPIAVAAYTGRASEQSKRALPDEMQKNVSTIHKLLGYAPVFEEYESDDGEIKERRVFRPTFNQSLKLPHQLFVLDEASMIPIPLFNELIDAIHTTSRIILVGDIHQLPPVMGKSVLGYAMRKWPVFELTKIHRQKEGNSIIDNAHRVLNGKYLEEAENFKIIGTGKQPSPGGMGELQKYFVTVVKKLQEMKRFDPIRDTIIVPGRDSSNGNLVATEALNPHFVTLFNPEVKENGIIVNKRIGIHTGTGHAYFAIRDKVMIESNINTVDPPITNGMMGIVESININGKYDIGRSQVDFNSDDGDDGEINLDLENFKLSLETEIENGKKEKPDEEKDQRQSSHVLTIRFENGQSFSASTAGDYRKITHGYAITCHKSQGGEYPNIIILCHSVNARMLSQEWLYTAITRARNNVYLVCNERGLRQSLSQQRIKGRTLAEKIQSYVMETVDPNAPEYDRDKYPILWEPKEI